MRAKTLIALGIGAAFALPLAGPDEVLAQSASAPVVHFSDIDRNGDGQISQTEWNAYATRGSSSSASGGASGGGTSSGTSGNAATTDRTPASSPTGVTAGPGSVSPRTGPGAATATQPSTSGHGKPK